MQSYANSEGGGGSGNAGPAVKESQQVQRKMKKSRCPGGSITVGAGAVRICTNVCMQTFF